MRAKRNMSGSKYKYFKKTCSSKFHFHSSLITMSKEMISRKRGITGYRVEQLAVNNIAY